ncbi:MAG: DNA-binding response regulator [Puniceicoccaceae bacterium]|nr:MAG: DNA-binding response regulator [Puniceicoccaceae bacterium]
MTILIIEDQGLFREFLGKLCGRLFPGAEVLCERDGAVGLERSRTAEPDLILIDLNLPDMDGLQLMELLVAEAGPATKVLVLSSRRDPVAIERALRAGVDGYVDKVDQSIEVLEEAVKKVIGGGVYFSPVVVEVRRKLRADPLAFSKVLTAREQEILPLLGRGLSNEEAAGELNLSPATVLTHRRNVMRKLGLHSTCELIRYAQDNGFVSFSQ